MSRNLNVAIFPEEAGHLESSRLDLSHEQPCKRIRPRRDRMGEVRRAEPGGRREERGSTHDQKRRRHADSPFCIHLVTTFLSSFSISVAPTF